MSIGDRPAYPGPRMDTNHLPGMNYRQWLIGQIASSIAAVPSGECFTRHNCIDFADRIIAALDAEQSGGADE